MRGRYTGQRHFSSVPEMSSISTNKGSVYEGSISSHEADAADPSCSTTIDEFRIVNFSSILL